MACNVSYVPKFGAPCSSVTMHILRRNLDCLFQISEPAVAVSRVSIHENNVTRGNKFKLQNQSFNHNFRQFFFSARTVNILLFLKSFKYL